MVRTPCCFALQTSMLLVIAYKTFSAIYMVASNKNDGSKDIHSVCSVHWMFQCNLY